MTKKVLLKVIFPLSFFSTFRYCIARVDRKESLLLILYHVHIFILLGHVVRREGLGAHGSTHRCTRRESKVRCRIARMRHVVARLRLIVEVVHLWVIRRCVVVVGVVLIVLIMPEVVRLVIGNVGEGVVGARLRSDWWRRCRHDRWVGAERGEIATGLAQPGVDIEIWRVVHRGDA